jgi:hypothetical protein
MTKIVDRQYTSYDGLYIRHFERAPLFGSDDDDSNRTYSRLHCVTGPAVYRSNVHMSAEIWAWHGMQFELNEWLDVNDQLSESEKFVIKLKYG